MQMAKMDLEQEQMGQTVLEAYNMGQTAKVYVLKIA